MPMRLEGVIAAAYTPFTADGELKLSGVEPLAEHLASHGLQGVFVAGTTGECSSLTTDERMQLARRWCEVARPMGLKVVIHVGHTAQAEGKALAAHAQESGADGIAAVAPYYLKPATVDALVDFLAPVAAAAPALPFYYYDIPPLTGCRLAAVDVLARAQWAIPTLAGLKYSNGDLVQLQEILALREGGMEVAFGCDEFVLAALALGCTAAVGSTYNFVPDAAKRLWRAFDAGDLPAARAHQIRIARVSTALGNHGYLSASKALMGWIGLECGPVRPPLQAVPEAALRALRVELEAGGLVPALAATGPAGD